MPGWPRLLAWLVVLSIFAAMVARSVQAGVFDSPPDVQAPDIHLLLTDEPQALSNLYTTMAWVAAALLFLLSCWLCTHRRLRARFEPSRTDDRHVRAFALFLLVSHVSLLFPDLSESGAWTMLFRVAPLAALASMRLQGSDKNMIIRDWGMHRGTGIWTEIGLGVAASVAFISVTILVGRKVIFAGALDASSLLWLVPFMCMALLYAPVVEEVLFRGALYRELRGSCWWWIAALGNGLLFAAWHPVVSWPRWASLLAFGFLACALREWRDSIVASITMHFCVNAFGVIMLLSFLL